MGANTPSRSILIPTVGRSDFGIARQILAQIDRTPGMSYSLLVSGAHLSESSGMTVREIEAEGRPISGRIPVPDSRSSDAATAATMGVVVSGVAEYLANQRPEMILLIGDRFEMAAIASAAVPFNIPLVHVHGGEVSYGAIDDVFRHAITKMAHLHFAAAEDYAKRIVRMGEEPWRVTVSGAPSLDNLRLATLPDRDTLARRLGLTLSQPPLVVTYHPVTRQPGEAERQTAALITALERFHVPIIITAPNADSESAEIRAALLRFTQGRANAHFFDNLGVLNYLALLREAAAAAGNSSSGLIETPAFGLPTVNIGDRQKGRTRAANVIDALPDADAITDAIAKALDPAFRQSLTGLQNPYGDGHAAERIVKVLQTTPLDARLTTKTFYDGPVTLTSPALETTA